MAVIRALLIAVWWGCGGVPVDADGDGHPRPSDCDDADPAVHPGAAETCDGVDEDCDGDVDEDASSDGTWYEDVDGDGFAGTEGAGCAPGGAATSASDCDDASASVHPGAAETCDEVDNDCDGLVDDQDDDWDVKSGLALYADQDGDGWGAGVTQHRCESLPGEVANNLDCDDDNAAVHPAAEEICNHEDDDCDGVVDPEDTCMWSWAQEQAVSSYYGASERGFLGYSVALSGALASDGWIGGMGEGGPAEAWLTDGLVVGDHVLDETTTRAHLILDAPGPGPDIDSITGCDLDGDGRLDVAVGSALARGPGGSTAGGIVSILLNPQGAYVIPADADAALIGFQDALGAGQACGAPSVDGVSRLIVGYPFQGGVGGAIVVAETPSGEVPLEELVGTRILGVEPSGFAGIEVAVADLTGDGVDDVIVGAEGTQVDGTPSAGAVHVVHGPLTSDVSLSDADTTLLGEGWADYVGSELAAMPDQDGDGLADLLVGGRSCGHAYVMNGPGPAGSSYVYELAATLALVDSVGQSAAVTSGDFDGDGLSDVAVANQGLPLGDSYGHGAVTVVPGPLEGLVFAYTSEHLLMSPGAAPLV